MQAFHNPFTYKKKRAGCVTIAFYKKNQPSNLLLEITGFQILILLMQLIIPDIIVVKVRGGLMFLRHASWAKHRIKVAVDELTSDQ